MIYLITGVPGSGKTLYAVSTLVQDLLKEKPKDADGNIVHRTLHVDAVSGLILPHVMMAPGFVQDDGSIEKGEGNGLWNWPDWCKKGDILFIDEVQRWWRPRGNGVKPPPDIKALETHRHKGVDFVIVTQNPMLIDQNVRRLVGRHINVRRLFGGKRALLYDWDSCAADVSRVQTATKRYWSYPKDAYKLYSSSELHTKPKQAFPIWLALPVLALVAAVFVAPKAYHALVGSTTGKGVGSAAAPAGAASAPGGSSIPPGLLVSLGVRPAAKVHDQTCISRPDSCDCTDANASRVSFPVDVCRVTLQNSGVSAEAAKTGVHLFSRSST